MEKLSGFDFQAVKFDRKGKVEEGLDELIQHVTTAGTTDLVVMCHGFRNDENDARALYGEFLKNLGGQVGHQALGGKLAGRKFAVAGAMWPSMVFKEADDSGVAMSAGTDAAAAVLRRLKEGLTVKRQKRIETMLKMLKAAAGGDRSAQVKMAASLIALVVELKGGEFAGVAAVAAGALIDSFNAGDQVQVNGPAGGASVGIPSLDAPAGGDGAAQSLFGNVFGFVPKFLNLTTFLLMFERCGVVGETGLAKLVREVKKARPDIKIHLAGHSLGGRAVTACANSLVADPKVQVDSMMLLQAAYSHFGLSPKKAKHPRGFFRDVIEKGAVKQPIVATHSKHDSVVGFAYTSMAALSLNNAKALGDENSQFGGIGRNGVLDAPESVQLDLQLAGQPYTFQSGKIYNLDGSREASGKKLIDSHGDVRNANVTWAFASLLAGA
ncbi:MAG TPA: hypothetical protein PKJ41_13275 [Bryobacteraceae bacterium]|nr:hypothetical protein [Bryobacteraceae bacterium]